MQLLPFSKKIYRAVHIYLMSQHPPATQPSTAVKAFTLLKALRSVGGNVQWRHHPALTSVASFLKYVRPDDSIEWLEDAEGGPDATSAYIRTSHVSAKIALKMLTSPLPRNGDTRVRLPFPTPVFSLS